MGNFGIYRCEASILSVYVNSSGFFCRNGVEFSKYSHNKEKRDLGLIKTKKMVMLIMILAILNYILCIISIFLTAKVVPEPIGPAIMYNVEDRGKQKLSRRFLLLPNERS